MPFVNPNLTLQTLLCAKSETEQGVEVTPVTTPAPSDVLPIHTETNPLKLDAKRITVQDITGSFTKDSDVIGRKLWPISFQMHLYGTGATGTDILPRWVRLLQACGHSVASGTSGGSSSWVLTPSTSGTSLTFNEYAAKTLFKSKGCLGTTKFDFPAGDAPNMTFSFRGNYLTPVTQASFPATIVKQTKVVKLVQSLGLVLGSLSPRASSIAFDLAVDIQEREDVNSAEGLYALYIADQNPMLDIMLEADEDQTLTDLGSSVNLYSALENTTTKDISWTHGSVAAGFTTTFAISQAQLVDLQSDDKNKRRMISTKWKLRNATANGQYTITHKEKA